MYNVYPESIEYFMSTQRAICRIPAILPLMETYSDQYNQVTPSPQNKWFLQRRTKIVSIKLRGLRVYETLASDTTVTRRVFEEMIPTAMGSFMVRRGDE